MNGLRGDSFCFELRMLFVRDDDHEVKVGIRAFAALCNGSTKNDGDQSVFHAGFGLEVIQRDGKALFMMLIHMLSPAFSSY